jgi:hypothetical protein
VLLDELNNNYIAGTDRYPKTLDDTIKLLTRYQGPQKNPAKVLDDNEDGMVKSFLQKGKRKDSPTRDKTNREKDDNDVGDSPRGSTNRQSRSPSRGCAEG